MFYAINWNFDWLIRVVFKIGNSQSSGCKPQKMVVSLTNSDLVYTLTFDS